MYYAYHNKLKSLLTTERFYTLEEKGNFAYRFVFPSLKKSYPIRDYRVVEYLPYFTEILYRPYQPLDNEKIVALFYNTVHTVSSKDYNTEQLNAWAPLNTDIPAWCAKFSQHYTIIAQKDSEILGFGDISSDGYLDRLYVSAEHQNCGIATNIVCELERSMTKSKHKTITTHASITAKPFFLHRGYVVVAEQTVNVGSIELNNFVMQKQLDA